jgi:NAD(P)H-flavin reductase
MNWILAKKELGKYLFQLEINASEIAAKCQPGQYVNLKIHENSGKFPAYIYEANQLKGSIQLCLQKTAVDSHLLSGLNPGHEVFEVSGPFGVPFETAYYGTVLFAAEALGIVPVYQTIKSLKAAGNHVIVLLSAKIGDYIFLERELRECIDEVLVMTDDGSRGKQGLLIQGMKELLQKGKIDRIYTIGSAHLVKYTSLLLQKHNIANSVFLFSRMGLSNGAGLIYNVSKVNSSKAICVDGPEFNAYYPNFDELVQHLGHKEEDQFSGNQDYQKAVSTPDYSYMIY